MSRPVLLIAGGSRGIGAATAKLAAGHGYDVAVNYKNNSNAAASVVEAVKKAGGKAVAIQGDMALENDIERVFDTANDTFGSLTHFVHSSGIIGDGSRSGRSQRARQSARYSTSTRSGRCSACAPACAACRRNMAAKAVSVVMLSSMAAPLGGANECVWYAAAKAGVDSMVIGVSREVAKEGIRVNAVTPGVIDTDIQPPGRIDRVMPMLPMGRAGQANEVAEAILFLAVGRRFLH